jgi:hypothetical protein
MEKKIYSDFSFAIDLIMETYKESNPVIISEKIKEDLDMEINIHQICDYLDMNRVDYDYENRKQYYSVYY